MTPPNPELRKFIVQFFSDDDLETLCFDYFPDARSEFGGGMSMERKVIVLIGHCERRDRLTDLHAALMRERAEAWNRAFASSVDHERERQMPKSDRRIHEKTGIELIRIPAGPFLYGDDKRVIDLPEYWISRYPVTNKDYKRFLDATPNHRVPFVDADWAKPYNWDEKTRDYPAGKSDHPVVLVSWHDAKAFCDWARLDLPTAAQWEKVARGNDGRLYPWGNEVPTNELCNFNGYVGRTTPVGRYSPKGDSPYGCADVVGNVWEWSYPSKLGDLKSSLRGGSWDIFEQLIHITHQQRTTPMKKSFNIGFRVAELLSDPAF